MSSYSSVKIRLNTFVFFERSNSHGEIKLLIVDSWTSFLWDNIANRSASMFSKVYIQSNCIVKNHNSLCLERQTHKMASRSKHFGSLRRFSIDETGAYECSVRSDYVVKFSVVKWNPQFEESHSSIRSGYVFSSFFP